jgi:hypothetical protein
LELVSEFKNTDMKKFSILIVLFWMFNACEKPSDCVESSGLTITKEIAVQPFKKIKVYRGIEVIITQGSEYKVEIVAGSNFIDNVDVRQKGDQLIFQDNVSCNWVRAYGNTKILVTTPTLEEVYSKTDRNISSNGVLTFPYISFIAIDKDGDGESGAGTGDFILNIDNYNLYIANNNVSRFYLTGKTEDALFNFYFGDGRIEAGNFTVQNMQIYHRGSNDMTVKPMQKITGIINSTGNIILKNVPPIVDVQELYQGRVIYQ